MSSGMPAGQRALYGSTSTFGPASAGYKTDSFYEVPLPKKAGKGRIQSQAFMVLTGLFLPWLVFAAMFAVEWSAIHYTSDILVKLVFLLTALLIVSAAGLAVRAWVKRHQGHDPSWYTFIAGTGALGLLLGTYLGDYLYQTYTMPAQDLQQLNVYTDIDPSNTVGQQVMDAGQIFFVKGARLDIDHSMGFLNADTYCVTPVVVNLSQSMPTYDFWAVGLNCCSGHAPNFHCGEYSNPKARGGLRLLSESLRSYYRLAVQQAEAAYNLHVGHPIFVEWMEDPVAEINAYQDAGMMYFLIGIFSYLGFQLLLVTVAVVFFARPGSF